MIQKGVDTAMPILQDAYKQVCVWAGRGGVCLLVGVCTHLVI